MPQISEQLPYAPLVDEELDRRIGLEARRAGEWFAVSLTAVDGTIATRRNARANAERHAGQLLTLWSVKRQRDHL